MQAIETIKQGIATTTSLVQRGELLLASLTKRDADMVDWDDQYKPYSGTMMQHKLTGEVRPAMRPKPDALLPENQQYEIVQMAYERAKQLMRKPSRDEVAKLLFELTLHTADKRMTEDEYKAKFSGMAKDLLEYPASLIREALENWRKRPDVPLYFPTTGQIKDAMSYRHNSMKKMFKRISVLAGHVVEDEVRAVTASAEMRGILDSVLEASQRVKV